MNHSETVQDYLKAIYALQTMDGRASTTSLAERLAVAPASVSGMIKKLASLRLITHEPYQGVRLTQAGELIALEVIRHHRLIELYLAVAMGVPWDRVHEEAERWEHVLSEELEERMDALLGYPSVDPHGAPIPRRDGSIPLVARERLSMMRVGCSGRVAEVDDRYPEVLRYLGSLGMYPGAHISLLDAAPFHGPLTVRVGTMCHVIGRELASQVAICDIVETTERPDVM